MFTKTTNNNQTLGVTGGQIDVKSKLTFLMIQHLAEK